MKLLITGGAGFIGSCFIKQTLINHPDYKIINLDKLTYCGNLSNLHNIKNNPNYKFIQGDICNKKLIKELISEIDCVINFAAETHVDKSIINPKSFIETNINGTYNLLEACKELKIKRYIQISTDEVYGELHKIGYFTEDSPLAPNNPYSASKASADLLTRAYFKTYKLPAIITRSANNYGPFQYPEKLIPFFISKLLKNEKIPIYGNGLNIRDWLYVYDNTNAIDIILHKGKEGEIYNIGAHNEKTNLEIAHLILKAMHKDESYIEYTNDRLSHDKRYAISNNKIRTELNWQPETTFNDGIKSTINWYLTNQDWINSVQKKEK